MTMDCYLKEYCEMYQVNYRDLVKQTGIPYSTLRSYIFENRMPSVENAIRISRALGLEVEVIWKI